MPQEDRLSKLERQRSEWWADAANERSLAMECREKADELRRRYGSDADPSALERAAVIHEGQARIATENADELSELIQSLKEEAVRAAQLQALREEAVRAAQLQALREAASRAQQTEDPVGRPVPQTGAAPKQVPPLPPELHQPATTSRVPNPTVEEWLTQAKQRYDQRDSRGHTAVADALEICVRGMQAHPNDLSLSFQQLEMLVWLNGKQEDNLARGYYYIADKIRPLLYQYDFASIARSLAANLQPNDLEQWRRLANLCIRYGAVGSAIPVIRHILATWASDTQLLHESLWHLVRRFGADQEQVASLLRECGDARPQEMLQWLRGLESALPGEELRPILTTMSGLIRSDRRLSHLLFVLQVSRTWKA